MSITDLCAFYNGKSTEHLTRKSKGLHDRWLFAQGDSSHSGSSSQSIEFLDHILILVHQGAHTITCKAISVFPKARIPTTISINSFYILRPSLPYQYLPLN